MTPQLAALFQEPAFQNAARPAREWFDAFPQVNRWKRISGHYKCLLIWHCSCQGHVHGNGTWGDGWIDHTIRVVSHALSPKGNEDRVARDKLGRRWLPLQTRHTGDDGDRAVALFTRAEVLFHKPGAAGTGAEPIDL
jgi:hypothetical protein